MCIGFLNFKYYYYNMASVQHTVTNNHYKIH